MKKFAIMALALGAISLGPISASASCGAAPDESTATIPASQIPEAGLGDIYVTDAPGLWQEGNDKAGLQTAAKSDGGALCWAADTDLTAAPSGVPPLPGDVPPVPGDVPPVPDGVPDPGSLPIPGLPV